MAYDRRESMSRARAGAVASFTALDVFALVSLANGNFPLTPATVNQAGFIFFLSPHVGQKSLHLEEGWCRDDV